jgi:hypothetical protein
VWTLLAEMLSLPIDGRYPALELTAQQRRQKTLEALTAQMEMLSRSNPILMILRMRIGSTQRALRCLVAQWTG